MPCSTLTQLADVLFAKPLNLSNFALESRFTQITTDTRSLKPGEVFVSLRGEKFDGHEFVSVAIEKGAIAAIVDFQFSNHDFPVLQVQDTLQAYQKIALWWREQFNIPVIGITGSVGKTTTKELIAAVLATKGNVLKTAANYNNETVGVITNVGTAHIGRLGSEEAIAQAKCELLAQMPSNSVAILNHDNSRLIATAKTVWQGETLTYGLEGGDIQGQVVDNQIYVDGMQLPLPLPGRHNASNFLAALAVAKVLQIDWSLLSAGLKIDLPSGRSQRYNLPNDLVILDESYNAAPEAMAAALNLLAETPGLRHIAVVGAMKELGERSPQFHKQVGNTARQLDLDALLILVDGADAEEIANGAEGMAVECFSSHVDLVKRLQKFVEKGDRILFKASHSVGLDRVVNQFCADFVTQD